MIKLGTLSLCALFVSAAIAKEYDGRTAGAGETSVDLLPKSSIQSTDGQATADVVVFVQPSYIAKYGAYEAHRRIHAWFDITNESYTFHGHDYRLRINDVVPVESIDNETPFHDVVDEDGSIAQDGAEYLFSMAALNPGNPEYDIYQTKWAADLVVYVREKRRGDRVNGTASINGELSNVLDNNGDAETYTTLAHEIGHNLGMDHEAENATSEVEYARATKCGGKSTIMYSSASELSEWHHYSDPEVTKSGAACGDYDIANNARVLRENFVATTQRRSGAGEFSEVSFAADATQISATEGEGAIFELVRVGDLSEPGTVKVFADNGTATFGEDFSDAFVLVEFEAGQERVSATFPLLDDAISESEETLTLRLQYPYQMALGSAASSAVKVNDGQAAGAAGDFVLSGSSTVEEGATQTYTVTRNGGSAQVSLSVALGGDDVFVGNDYLAPDPYLVFEDGDIEKTFTIHALEDTEVEADKTVTITLSSQNETATISEPKTITIVDNDQGNYGDFELATDDSVEAGETLSVTVSRTGGEDAVTVMLENSDGVNRQVSFEQGQLSKTVTVKAPDSGTDITLTLTSTKQGMTLPAPIKVKVSTQATPVEDAAAPGNDSDSSGGGSMGWLIVPLAFMGIIRRLSGRG